MGLHKIIHSPKICKITIIPTSTQGEIPLKWTNPAGAYETFTKSGSAWARRHSAAFSGDNGNAVWRIQPEAANSQHLKQNWQNLGGWMSSGLKITSFFGGTTYLGFLPLEPTAFRAWALDSAPRCCDGPIYSVAALIFCFQWSQADKRQNIWTANF